jgi:transposase
MVIVDAQSVQNASSGSNKGYDGGKKISGVKRHMGVDTNGLPHTLSVTPANITDRNGALFMFKKSPETMAFVEKALCDGGYTGEKFANEVQKLCGVEVEIAKRNELHTFAVIPRRWVVERSFAWLEKCRRLWRNCERLLISSMAMIQIAFIRILLRRL